MDPDLLGIPTYFKIIPKEKARDLRTIQQKLDADKYDTVQAFEADLDLMICNAIVFNGADSEVGAFTVKLQNRYRELLAPIFPTSSRISQMLLMHVRAYQDVRTNLFVHKKPMTSTKYVPGQFLYVHGQFSSDRPGL